MESGVQGKIIFIFYNLFYVYAYRRNKTKMKWKGEIPAAGRSKIMDKD